MGCAASYPPGTEALQSGNTDLDRLRRAAVGGVVLALVVSVPANLAFFAAFGWDIEAAVFGTPSAILDRAPSSAALLRWGAIGDMFYSYLLLVPLALFLHRRLRPNGPWLADLGLAAGLAYIFVGGAGAAILAIAGSGLVEAYGIASPADRPLIALSFETLRNVVYFALWQMLDGITAGTWVLTTGLLLLPERVRVSRLLIVLGACLILLTGMTMLGVHSLPVLLALLGAAMVVWAGWLAVTRNQRNSPAR